MYLPRYTIVLMCIRRRGTSIERSSNYIIWDSMRVVCKRLRSWFVHSDHSQCETF